MGLIWNLASLAKNAKQAVGSLEQVKGQTARCYGALKQVQDNLIQKTYEKAQAGNHQAQFDMGERFFQGLGVPKDYTESAAWFLRAARQGHPRAQNILAMMFFLGRGVNADPAEAYKWICLAAVCGEDEILTNKRKIASKISLEALAEGEKRVAGFKIVIETPPPQVEISPESA
jgi:TPR repeat protein